MAKSRLTKAKSEITSVLAKQQRRIFQRRDLATLLKDNRRQWDLTNATTVDDLIEYLCRTTELRKHEFDFPSRAQTLFTWGDVSTLSIACALRPKAYLSHYSAMHIHDLTEQLPETIYVNEEQRPQPKPDTKPTQASIDRAFHAPQRMSRNLAKYGRYHIVLLNGKQTGQAGVVELRDGSDQAYRVTGLERTLIDIVVRPAYSGGVAEIVKAYRRAADRVQINRLLALLHKIDLTYPYTQAIGFFMEKSGAYSESRLKLLEQPGGFMFDFYAAHGIRDKDYSARWRIYFPSGLEG